MFHSTDWLGLKQAGCEAQMSDKVNLGQPEFELRELPLRYQSIWQLHHVTVRWHYSNIQSFLLESIISV